MPDVARSDPPIRAPPINRPLTAPMKMHASVESTPVESETASAEAAEGLPADMPDGGTTMPERAGVPDMRDAR